MVNNQPAVKITNFSKRYQDHVAVKKLDLTIQKGEIFGLIGPDGAGKSSLMKSVAGVLEFEEGNIEIFGTSLETEASAEAVKSRLGFMPQGLGLNLYPDLSIEENIDFFARLRLVSPQELAERKETLLAMTRLDKFRTRAMKNLSGGMKQKLGLVCTLIHAPDLIILDEPTTGVDPVSRRDFWAILAQLLLERGITALISTAYMEEASRFHRINLFHEGEVLAQGSPDEIMDQAPGSEVMLKVTPQTTALTCLKQAFDQVDALGSSVHVFVPKLGKTEAVKSVQEKLSECKIEDIQVRKPDLEKIFIALLQQKGVKIEVPTVHIVSEKEFTLTKNNQYSIEAQKLSRSFGEFKAVDEVSFQVPQGEIFGLLGANGAGKTTVIKMLTGILPPSSGQGHVAGASMTGGKHQEIKNRIGYMSQAFSLYTDLTVMENITLYAGIYGLSRKKAKERAEWIIETGGLQEYRKSSSGSLPMGLRQRLALGCSMVHEPQVLFLDEPTSGVDPIGRRKFWDILYALSRDQKVSILVTTHYLSESEHCDHIALLFAGRVVADATPEEMKMDVEREAGKLVEIATDQPMQSVQLLKQAGYRGVSLFGTRLHLLSDDIDRDRIDLTKLLESHQIKVSEFERCPLSMEDVFVYKVTQLEGAKNQEAV